MDTLTSMRVFTQVVEMGSFTLAAQRFAISRPMVSKHVEHLEAHLGTRLLHRTTRSLVLTESGRDYYNRCVLVLGEIDEAEAIAGKLAREPRGLLRVSMPISFSVRHMGPVLALYAERYPHVQIELRMSDQLTNLVEEGVDIAIRIGPAQEGYQNGIALGIDRLTVCGAPAYFARRGLPRSPQDLAQHNCLLYSHAADGGEWRFQRDNKTETVRVCGTVGADNGDILAELAVQGVGLVRMPTFIVGHAISTGQLQPILQMYDDQVVWISALPASRKFISSKVRFFIDVLQETKHLWLEAGRQGGSPAT